LTPVQVEDTTEERDRLRKLLDPSTPEFVRSQVQDKAEAVRQLRSIDKNLARQAPKPYTPEEIDSARYREGELREKILQGMPSQAEMRRNPPGTVDKHVGWERRNKQDILEWKNVRRRLYASGALEEAGATGRDVSNLEIYRPADKPTPGQMDNAQIPGKQFYFPTGNIDVKHGLSDEEYEKSQEEKRELMRRIEALEQQVAEQQAPVKRGRGRPKKQPTEE
jgi:hypothetical protein